MIGPLPWIGGKRRIAKKLAALLPEHETYVEPFCGGAQVFFHKERSRVEVLNDLDGELVNFLRVVQAHHPELVRYLQFHVASRKWFEHYRDLPPSGLTDVQRAARFFYLQKNSFAGRVHQRNFHYGVLKPGNFDPSRISEVLNAVAARLARVQIESLPYEEILTRYDRETTCFYIDPPYVGAPWYNYNLSDDEFPKLAARLQILKGRFLLSINDCEIARDAFKAFHMREISLAYTAARSVPTVRELLFANYELPEENVDSSAAR